MGTTVHSREGGSPGKAFDLAELREDEITEDFALLCHSLFMCFIAF